MTSGEEVFRGMMRGRKEIGCRRPGGRGGGRSSAERLWLREGWYPIPQTGWLINNKKSFLSVLEAGRAKIKAPAWLLPDEGSLLTHGGRRLVVPHTVGERHPLFETFLRVLISFLRAPLP